MNTLLATIFVALLAGVLARNVPNEDEIALQAVEELRHKLTSRLLSDVSPPKCTDKKKKNSIECCIELKWMKQKRTICIDLGVNVNKVQVNFALSFDGEQIFDHDLNVGEICAPLPGVLKKVNICIHAYYVNIDTKPPGISFDACFVAKLGGFFHLRLNCIRLEKNGKFIQHSEIKPESKGILMLSLEEGNLKFDMHNPIPKEVMNKIEQGWNIFGKEAGNLVDNAGKEITDAAKKVENEISKTADKVKDKFTDIGNKITGWLG